MTIKFCTKCGKKFMAIGREVICPDCKQAAAEDAKRAAVMKAKRASWNGESVPVRISGRASTVIRRYGAANNMPFAAALDDLLKSTDYFKSVGTKWEEVEPYKSHRRDKTTSTTETAQEAPHDATSKPQEVKTAQEVKQAAGKPQEVKQEAKTSTSKAAGKAASKTSKQAAGKAGKKA